MKFRERVNILLRLVPLMRFLRRQKRLKSQFLCQQLACLLVLALEIFFDVSDWAVFIGLEVLDDRVCVLD